MTESPTTVTATTQQATQPTASGIHIATKLKLLSWAGCVPIN